MSRLSQLALAKRSVTLLLAGALFIAGVSAWGSLKQELLPDIEFPVITVIAPFPGAGSQDVADQVAEPIERAISGVARLETVQSTSANSIALVIAQFSYGTDVKAALTAIEDGIADAGLPDPVEPSVSALNINASPVIIASIAATSQDGLDAVAEIARDEIIPELTALEGVSRADVTGGLEQRLLITLDPAKLAASNVSVSQISGILSANNLTFPSGQLSGDGTKIPVSTIGRLTSVDQIEGLVVGFTTPAPIPGAPTAPTASGVPTASGAPAASGDPALQPSAAPVAPVAPVAPTPITIGDLGTVEEVEVATTGFGRTNGQPSLALSVTKTSDANTVLVAESVQETLDEIAARHPGVLTITTVSNLADFIKESTDGLLREGGLGAVFAILTIFLFLFSVRSTIVAAISIPLSILTALVVMQLTGITLNIMTLGGLAVAVGRVVDDAIVVLENIYRHRALGEDRMTASLNGPKEVAGAITASTLTTVAVFLPLGFVGGLVSQFFLPFALTVTFALLASLICALTVVPVLAYLLIDRVNVKVDASGEPVGSRWVRVYSPTITWVLKSRWTALAVVVVSGVLFVASLALVPLLPTQFINAGSEKILQVSVAPPAGATSEAVLAQATEAETILLADPDVELVQTSIPGEGDTSFQTIIAAQSGRPANSATLTVRLDPAVDLGEKTAEISTALAPVKSDGYDVQVSEAAGFTSNGLNVIVSSPDPVLVESTTESLVEALSTNADLLNLKSDLVKATAEIQVTVDPDKAIAVGLTAAQVAQEVRTALVAQTATQVSLEPGQPVDLVIQVDPEAVTSVDELRQLPVGTVAKVPLGEVATVEQADVQGSITRIDQAPAASITAEIASDDTGAVSLAVQTTIDDLTAAGTIPAGVTVELAGVSQQQSEAFGGLFASMGVAVLLVYVMMVLTFNSLVTPFIILFSLPLATIGAFVALYVTGRPIGVSALIGFLMLIGIVVTNAIVLLDLVERLRAEGHPTREALIEGGRTRVRPILMTAIATILALIPLAAGFNQGSIIAAELGTVVIGGLFSSTFLTLL
ncbi:MAG TPA: efflux RND transporter permease subunit, partial [Candidatus Saccharimonadales bacterium]|nr:efflux RND transporter permease subunit [Candidatus Saccharimonadales bacterium]